MQYNIYEFLSNIYYKIKYWIIYRTTDQYHIIRTGLKPGYYDVDYRLVHGMFNLLVEFVEKEYERIDWNSDDDHKHAAKEMKELYKWWKEVYPFYDKNSPIHSVEPYEITDEPCAFDSNGKPSLYKMKCTYKDENHEKRYQQMLLDLRDYEDKMYKEIKDNMIRLVNIHQYLWS